MADFGDKCCIEIVDDNLEKDKSLEIFFDACPCGYEQSAFINRTGSIEMIKKMMMIYGIDAEELRVPPPCDACGKPIPDGDNVGVECNLHRGCAVVEGGNNG